MTADMIMWLRGVLDEREALANATTPVPVAGSWCAKRDKHAHDDDPLTIIQGTDEYVPDDVDYSSNVPVIAHAADWHDEAEDNLLHIAANDPRSVLADVAAKRELLDRCVEALDALNELGNSNDHVIGSFADGIETAVHIIASAYAGRDGYREEWGSW